MLGAIRLSIFLSIVFIIAWVPIADPLWLTVPAFILLALSLFFSVRWTSVIRRWFLLEPFVVGIWILAWDRAEILVLKGSLSLWAMIILSEVMSFSEILKALRKFCVPLLLINTISLMYRYRFLLVQEAARMKRARYCRSFDSSNYFRRKMKLWWLEASVAGQLFIRTVLGAERVYSAMCARGWNVSGN